MRFFEKLHTDISKKQIGTENPRYEDSVFFSVFTLSVFTQNQVNIWNIWASVSHKTCYYKVANELSCLSECLFHSNMDLFTFLVITVTKIFIPIVLL